MDNIGDICEVIMNFINELIVDRAFNKEIKLSKRIPFIIIYVLVILLLLSFLTFIGINLVIQKNIFGYFLLVIALLILFMLIYPFIFYKKK